MQNEIQTLLAPPGLRMLDSQGHSPNQPDPPHELPLVPKAQAARFLLWLIIPFLLCDLSFGIVSYLDVNARTPTERVLAPLVMAVWVGIIVLQATVLNVYLVFTPDAWWKRLAIVLPQMVAFASAGLCGMWFLFLAEDWHVGFEQFENGVRFFCALPLIMVAVQTPLLICRAVFGWQMTHVTTNEPQRQPVSILQLMLGTAAVAGCLGLIRLAPTKTLEEPEMLWVMVGVFSVIAVGCSLLGTIPLLLLFHAVKSHLWRLVVAAGLLLLAAIIIFAIYAALTPWPQVRQNGPLNTAVFSMLIFTFQGGLSGSLYLLRLHGWKIEPARVHRVV